MKTILTLVLFVAVHGVAIRAQEQDGSDLFNHATNKALELDFKNVPERDAIWVLQGIAESCDKLDKPELAETFMNLAESIANESGRIQYLYQVFYSAIKFQNLDKAEEIARRFGPETDSLLDNLDLERYRRGDRNALKNFPRKELDFFGALKLADSYVATGDYEKAEEFVTHLDIPEEPNDPRGVGAFTFRNIAKIYRDRGDMENAKKYIDKAMAIGGNLYYSGYGIQIAKRSIYGELTDDLDSFAQLGANYREHMGRELVQLLIAELISTGHLQEAQRICKYVDDEEDRDDEMKRIAIAQARQGDRKTADQTIDQIRDESKKSLARLGIAKALWQNGEHDTASVIAAAEFQTLKTKDQTDALDKPYQALADLYGMMGNNEKFSVLLNQTDDLRQQSYCLMNAIQGYTESQRTDAKQTQKK